MEEENEKQVGLLETKDGQTKVEIQDPDDKPDKKSKKSRKIKILIAIVLLLLLIIVVIVVIGLALGFANSEDDDEFETDGSPLKYFNVDGDAMKISWYHAANSQAKINEAINGNYMMVEADITLRGTANQTDEPIMAHPPDIDSDLTFDEWAEKLIETDNKGMKMDFKYIEAVKPSLQILADKEDVHLPIWANADILQGPGGQGSPLDHVKFLEAVDDIYDDVTLSLGWNTGCCSENYTQAHVQAMWDVVKDLEQPVTFTVRAALVRPSWNELRWLINKDPERFSLTVWTSAGVSDWEGATEWDMLYCRNDMCKSKIYFDLTNGTKWDELQAIAITAGSPLNHFKDIDMGDMDGIDVSWANAVNSQDKLTEFLDSDVMMLEGDVSLRGEGTSNETNIPIMANLPDTESDITLQEWLDKVIKTEKGIKLHFNSIGALQPALNIFKDNRKDFVQPVFLNADILQGPGGSAATVDSAEFKRIVNEVFPYATLSLGWTTGQPQAGVVYDAAMVTEMKTYITDLKQPITFSLRAALIKESWDTLKPLLDMSRGHTFTIWSDSADEVKVDDLVYIRQNSDVTKVYYNLPKDLMEKFEDAIE